VADPRPYRMTLDLRILDHLGIKLYSNAAAVLSEAVANGWDADAEQVSMTISNDKIVIEDDGTGMNLGDINDRFLTVGYDKRAGEGETSAKGRPFMGRKGIGKLALFSIAGMIDIHTQRNGEKHAFRMNTADIREAIQKREEYRPIPIAFDGPTHGTRIILRELTKKRTASTITALRRRLARRFSIIGLESKGGKDKFGVLINGTPVGNQDREDLKAIEFLWEFGEARVPTAAVPNLRERVVVKGEVDPEEHPAWVLRGWIGAAAKPKTLKEDEAGSMNGIVVIARGRLIQENLLANLNFSRIFGSYITGQIEADFLDAEGEEDIATSDRQRLVEDDIRYIRLSTFVRETLFKIGDQWTAWRNEHRGKDAVDENPALKEWVESLPAGQQKNAKRLLGLVGGVDLEDESERRSLYRSGMLAFERLRVREESDRLATTGQWTAAELLPLLADLETFEGALYRDIVKSRLDVIKRFEGLVDADEKEKVLQAHLFENLWLLDPGWERAAGSARIEQTLKKDYKAFSKGLSDEESKGRIDIRYRTNAEQHIVVELKKARRQLKLSEVVEQVSKYREGLRKCLKAAGFADPQIRIVVVVGKEIAEEKEGDGATVVAETLKGLNTRVVNYETLIHAAQEAYAEYLKASEKSDKLAQILNKL
jgi:hypothetical protein